MAESKGFECASGSKHTFVVKKAKLKKLEILEGAPDTFLTKNAEQFVNLNADAKWVDNKIITSEDRLGHEPRLYVEFDLPGVSEFTLKAVGQSKNEIYTSDEKSRNAKFKFLEAEKKYQTESNGKLTITDAFIDIAGENKFHFEAEDSQGTKLKSKTLEVKRKLFIQEIKMSGDSGKTAASSIKTATKEFNKQGFEMETLTAVNMTEMENIGPSEEASYLSNVQAAYKTSDGKKKEPYTLTIGYTSNLAVKTTGQALSKTAVKVGPKAPKPKIKFAIAGPGKTNPAVSSKPLWQKIITGEGWFEKCEFKDAATGVVTKIDEKHCKAIPVNSANPNFCIEVEVDVSKIATPQTGKLTLTVSWVDRMRAGLSFNSNNLICVCTKAYWQTMSASDQNEVIIHEFGHKIGMVPDGSGILPEKTATFYDSSKGHVGTHCHKGIPAGQARYDSNADAALSACVMYGSTNGHSAFCDNCSVAAKKQDVSAGWATI